MSSEQPQETWQVEANGRVFETHFDEMTEWIADGSLLRIDRVRKANLRWIEAGKVPALLAVFNAKDNGELLPTSSLNTTQTDASIGHATDTAPSPPADHRAQTFNGTPECVMHEGVPAAFVCKICTNHFCKACPNSYGGTVKICPLCGAMCTSVADAAEPSRSDVYYPPVGHFGFGDFLKPWPIRSNSKPACSLEP